MNQKSSTWQVRARQVTTLMAATTPTENNPLVNNETDDIYREMNLIEICLLLQANDSDRICNKINCLWSKQVVWHWDNKKMLDYIYMYINDSCCCI